jgi:hypothetical protein
LKKSPTLAMLIEEPNLFQKLEKLAFHGEMIMLRSGLSLLSKEPTSVETQIMKHVLGAM